MLLLHAQSNRRKKQPRESKAALDSGHAQVPVRTWAHQVCAPPRGVSHSWDSWKAPDDRGREQAAREREEGEGQTFLHCPIWAKPSQSSRLPGPPQGYQSHHKAALHASAHTSTIGCLGFFSFCTITLSPGHRSSKSAQPPSFDFGLCEYWPPVSLRLMSLTLFTRK